MVVKWPGVFYSTRDGKDIVINSRESRRSTTEERVVALWCPVVTVAAFFTAGGGENPGDAGDAEFERRSWVGRERVWG